MNRLVTYVSVENLLQNRKHGETTSSTCMFTHCKHPILSARPFFPQPPIHLSKLAAAAAEGVPYFSSIRLASISCVKTSAEKVAFSICVREVHKGHVNARSPCTSPTLKKERCKKGFEFPKPRSTRALMALFSRLAPLPAAWSFSGSVQMLHACAVVETFGPSMRMCLYNKAPATLCCLRKS